MVCKDGISNGMDKAFCITGNATGGHRNPSHTLLPFSIASDEQCWIKTCSLCKQSDGKVNKSTSEETRGNLIGLPDYIIYKDYKENYFLTKNCVLTGIL